MRKFQVTNIPGLEADVLGTFGHFDSKSLTERIAFIDQFMEEKNIAKHFPGPHFSSLQMDLTQTFKDELAKNAKEIFMKKFIGKELFWLAAKALGKNSTNIEELSPLYQDMIEATKHAENAFGL